MGIRWQRENEQAFQVWVSKCWCKCYFMFHKTAQTHLGWTSNTAWHPSGLLRNQFSAFCAALLFPRSLTLQLQRASCVVPLGPPVTQGPPPCSGWIQTIPASWGFQIETTIPVLPKHRKGKFFCNCTKRIPDLLAYIQCFWFRNMPGTAHTGESWGSGSSSSKKRRDYVLQQVIGPSLLLTWRNPGCLFPKSHQ